MTEGNHHGLVIQEQQWKSGEGNMRNVLFHVERKLLWVFGLVI